jgi:repressor LexA
MEKITEKQRKVLAHISGFISDYGRAPSIREIAGHFNVSIGAAQKHISALVRKGHLKHTPGLSRGIMPVSHKPLARVPVLGSVPAGSPSEAIEGIEDYLYLEKGMVLSGTYFALKVKGDSMTGAGIYEGDTIVIRQQADAEDGEIVVAKIDGSEGTVKRLRKNDTGVYLQPENPKYAPIRGRNIEISGKVVYLTRKV